MNFALNRIIAGDALGELRKFPSESVDCLVTSPPYWALRDYNTRPLVWDGDQKCRHGWETMKQKWHSDRGSNKRKEIFDDKFQTRGTINDVCKKCSAWRGSLGQEPRMELFIKHLCDIFDEVKRVLKKTGTCWVNIGDTYSATRWTGNGKGQPMNKFKDGHRDINPEKITGLEDKNLVLIPFRFALEMQSRGWIVRNVIIWHKPSCMPSSAKDRFTVDFEYLFLFAKNKNYYFETQYEPVQECSIARLNRAVSNKHKWLKGPDGQTQHTMNRPRPNRNKYKGGGDVGRKNNCAISTYQFDGGDYLVSPFNPELGRNKRCVWRISTKPFKEAHFAVFPEELVETPIKAGCPKSGIVLDPFMGSGTTAVVAKRLGRNYVGIELNPKYIKMAERRIRAVSTIRRENVKSRETGI